MYLGNSAKDGTTRKEDTYEMKRENINKWRNKERDRGNEDSAFEQIRRRLSSDETPDRSAGSDECNNPAKETKGNLRIFEVCTCI